MVSLTQLQEIPSENMILLVGPPGSGKSTFCHQAVLSNIEMEPVIYVTTESAPSKVEESLRQKGLGEVSPHPLNFVDAFHDTVGLSTPDRPDSIIASCQDLTSLGIAISKLQERMREKVLLVFDSLTSPYVFNGSEILRFMRMTLSRFAAQGNAVLACVDEGCGKPEDMVTMMSTADGIIKIVLMDGSKTFNIMKHPKVEPTKIEVVMTWRPEISYQVDWEMHREHMRMFGGLTAGPPLRTEVGDFVNVFWPNFARWCGMLWDPKRFPTMTYNANKRLESEVKELLKSMPWHVRLLLRFMPKDFSKAKDMKKVMSMGQRQFGSEGDRDSILEYVEEISKTDEHYVRAYESTTCWGFDNVGAALALGDLGLMAGVLSGFEKDRGGPDRDWNAVETKCIGLGDPYCEIKIVPGEIDELKGSLEAIDNTMIERIQGRLMDQLMRFLLQGKPLWERPTLGNEVGLHTFSHLVVIPATISERCRMAIRLGGAMGGKAVGEHLMDAGIREDEAVQHIHSLLEQCKVGRVTMDETIRIRENCESSAVKSDEPSCFFTTGFLNGFFSAVKNQHVKETKCIAIGDPYCEWEFR